MCGIVGYVGSRQAAPLLLAGLEKLSYRGYDSAGVAVMDTAKHIHVRKARGKVSNLKHLVEQSPLYGYTGIGHTRWATHGEPTDTNAHPHTDAQGGIAVVHNGIVENHSDLRRLLKEKGFVFVSQTDTEVIAHLLRYLYKGSMLKALRQATEMLKGSYALAVLCADDPGVIYCVRNANPLVIGFDRGEGLIASDVPAMIDHTRDVLFLEDKEIALLTKEGITVYDACGPKEKNHFTKIDWKMEDAQKGGYAHYMLKEIHEQPSALQKTFAHRLSNDDWLPISTEFAQKIKKITIAACGSAYHAGVMAKYMFESLAHIPVSVELASEYRYHDVPSQENELFVAVSQSGETADTLAAVRKAQRNHIPVLAVCNVVGSSLAREVGEQNTLYTYAGPEIAVASTKAYLTQVELLMMIAVELGRKRKMISEQRVQRLISAFDDLPAMAEETLGTFSQIQRLADHINQKKHVFFIGRGVDYALAMEAALKLKEVSYMFCEAYASGELKHGPLALLNEGELVVAIVTQKDLADKALNNLQEVSARGGRVIVVCTRQLRPCLTEIEAEYIVVPDADELLAILLAAIPLQLFAYCMAVARGCDVDQPRNLAKSVTVE